jgi:ATP-dependent RNA helicase DHX8/PRP22
MTFTPKWNTNSICINAIRNCLSEEVIKQRLLVNIPFCKEIDYSLILLYEDGFGETDASFLSQRDRLDSAIAQCTDRSNYHVDFLRPSHPKQVLYRAFVYFEDSVLCSRIFQHLHDEYPKDNSSSSEDGSEDESDESEFEEFEDESDESDFEDKYRLSGSDSEDESSNESDIDGGRQYQVQLSLSSSTRYTPQVFSVIKASIELLRFSIPKSATIDCDKRDRWGNVFVKVTADDLNVFTEVKEMLATAVEPEVMTFPNCSTGQYISTLDFQTTTKEIQTQTSTYIKNSASSLSTSSIAIYGTKERRLRARENVESHLQGMMQDGIRCFEIKLREYGPGLMKYLVAKYGHDISQLTQAVPGITATRLNPRRQILTLFATEAGRDAFLHSLISFQPENISPQAQSLDKVVVSECCICYEPHNSENRKTFFYRLECCGHVYCRECIQQQLEATSIEFPVTCAADKCEEQLVWRDFENLFKDKVKDLRDITTASLKSYIARNPDKVRNCITPDCNMMYTSSSEGKRFVCRQCGANICTQCHTTWHEGYDSCAAYKNRNSTTSGDAELKMWMSSDRKNRKNCPKCSAPIEKVDGCQHVPCSQCKVHICWECLEYFVKSGDCYDHLSAEHGGAL